MKRRSNFRVHCNPEILAVDKIWDSLTMFDFDFGGELVEDWT